MDDPAGSYPPYDQGLAQNVFITESDGVTPLAGRVRSLRATSRCSWLVARCGLLVIVSFLTTPIQQPRNGGRINVRTSIKSFHMMDFGL